jgi:hypothetical protein
LEKEPHYPLDSGGCTRNRSRRGGEQKKMDSSMNRRKINDIKIYVSDENRSWLDTRYEI